MWYWLTQTVFPWLKKIFLGEKKSGVSLTAGNSSSLVAVTGSDNANFSGTIIGTMTKEAPHSPTPGERLEKIRHRMEPLLDEIKKDVQSDPTRNTICLMRKSLTYSSFPTCFAYYYEDHPKLDGHFHDLEEARFVRNDTVGDLPRYLVLDDFIEALLK